MASHRPYFKTMSNSILHYTSIQKDGKGAMIISSILIPKKNIRFKIFLHFFLGQMMKKLEA